MKKYQSSQRGLNLTYADFIQKVNSYGWKDCPEEKLGDLLRKYPQSENENKTPYKYSIIKEIIRRKTGLSLFDSQLMAAYAMQQGRIAELPTGEGKTLAAVVTASYFALEKKPVHILVFNDYLARRDYQANLSIYTACGLACGYIEETSDFTCRKAAYSQDIVYVSAKAAAFDYLRDFLCTDKEQLLQNAFSIALVDEADSIFIDEARTPLVLAGYADKKPSMAAQISRAVSELEEWDVGINRDENQVWLTEAGIKVIEEKTQASNLYVTKNTDILALVNAALEARFLLEKDKDYIVKNGCIQVIDETTGRVVQNRRFPDLLHQAVEIQETGLSDTPSIIYNSMSMQAFLLQYEMLCGMTGTAASSAAEFREMYDLKVAVIPPHTPCIRMDHPDVILMDKDEQENAVINRILSLHVKGQPILVGTGSVRESEHISVLLTEKGIVHKVLNARNNAEEAEIIAEAGRPYQITISTNIAGRGVDIRLGGSDEKQAEFVRAAGGLFVISTGINPSIRIDNQLRGRAGRQGDPGESQFFICLNDLKLDTFFEIEFYKYKKYPKLLRRAQKIQEGMDAEARYMLERYSRTLEEQRKQITYYRQQLLLDITTPEIMQQEDPFFYQELTAKVGKQGVTLAEKQLTLYFINVNWASYLSAMEDKRNGIHLTIIGGENPLIQYQIFAVSAFAEMMEDIKNDVLTHMKKCRITEKGIDMEEAGLLGASTTWSYMVDESASQFSRIPHLAKSMSNTIQGTLFTFRDIAVKLKKVFHR